MAKELVQGGGLMLGNSIVRVDLIWPEFEKYLNGTYKSLAVQFIEDSEKYLVFCLDDGIVYTCTLVKTPADWETFPGQAEQDAHNAERAAFEASYKSGGNKVIVAKNSDGNLLQVNEPRTGLELIEVTHNFCDPTTWWTQSERAFDEVLTDSGDGLTWTAVQVNWIDMTHGKVFDEGAIVQVVAHTYAVVVKVDGVIAVQREPYAASGGDYDVDYKLGKVMFFQSQAGKAVTASYSYENGSEWRLVPDPGKRVDLEAAEAQFSKDAVLNDDVEFDVWGYNPTDLPNKVPYARSTYKKFVNYVDEALGSYPVVPPIGGTGRGSQTEIYGFPFRYGTIKKIQSSLGLELRVRLKKNRAFGGEHCTATFYCTVRKE